MEIWLYALIGVMAVIITGLVVKIYNIQRSAKDIKNSFADRLMTDTNTLIDVSCGDKYMRDLANVINIELRKLRMKRHRYERGGMELKNAITNISHDLRTPLTAVCGYLDLLEQEEKSEVVGRYLEVIKNRTEMMKQLTEELFRYSVILSIEENMSFENIGINGVLEECIAAAYDELTRRKIVPEIYISEKPIVRRLDKNALSRIFNNLINNALKYSDGDLSISLLDNGEIVFQNTAEKLDQIGVGQLFDRFFSVDVARNSTGLGLSIVKTLVEQMNGTITAEYERKQLKICIVFPEGEIL